MKDIIAPKEPPLKKFNRPRLYFSECPPLGASDLRVIYPDGTTERTRISGDEEGRIYARFHGASCCWEGNVLRPTPQGQHRRMMAFAKRNNFTIQFIGEL